MWSSFITFGLVHVGTSMMLGLLLHTRHWMHRVGRFEMMAMSGIVEGGLEGIVLDHHVHEGTEGNKGTIII